MAALQGRDSFVLMATGSGKSLCYQLPSLISGKMTIVVSPLISLMEDQVLSLQQLNIRACALFGNVEDAIYQDVAQGKYTHVYLTPEKLTNWMPSLNTLHETVGIGLFAIDEAHCVSEWGHDFRKDYRLLNVLRQQIPDVPIMALVSC